MKVWNLIFVFSERAQVCEVSRESEYPQSTFALTPSKHGLCDSNADAIFLFIEVFQEKMSIYTVKYP